MSSPNSKNALQILDLLKKEYPNAKTILNYSNEWELLVAVILSAQCTDIQVNKVTEKLFKKYKTIKEYAEADIHELEQDIRSTGFYKNKARSVRAAAKMILEQFGGVLPRTIDQMIKIPGAARKTANVVLGNAFGIHAGIAVDTHVKRLSGRLGLSNNLDPNKIEQDLMKLYEQKDWFRLTYVLIDHGRKVCEAKKPKCDECILNKLCPSAFKFPHFVIQ